MKKKTWREAIKKNPRTKYLLNWEKKQAYGNYKKGVAVGLILGALSVGVLTIIFMGILR